MTGPEAEFFLFRRDANGDPIVDTHDSGGYFDLTPVDRGEDARRDIVVALEAMGFEVEAAHHEVAPGQHEIDFSMATPSPRPTTSRPSSTSSRRSRWTTASTPPSCRNRSSA